MKTILQSMLILLMSVSFTVYGNGVIDTSKIFDETTVVNSIKAQGPFNMFVKIGADAKQTALSCDQDRPGLFKAHVENHTLYLTSQEKHLTISVTVKDLEHLVVTDLETVSVKAVTPTQLSIHANHIDSLTLFGEFTIPKLIVKDVDSLSTNGKFDIAHLKQLGKGIVDLDGLRGPKMVVHHTGVGNLHLKGYVDVVDILKSGSGNTRLWNVGSSIAIQATGKGQIELIGYAKKLTADLSDSVSLNAFALYANSLFISTTGHAFARVHPLNRLFAAARHNSRISYNQIPPYIYIDPMSKGLVLYSSEGLGLVPTLPKEL